MPTIRADQKKRERNADELKPEKLCFINHTAGATAMAALLPSSSLIVLSKYNEGASESESE